jgi:uncharacterized protein YkwD
MWRKYLTTFVLIVLAGAGLMIGSPFVMDKISSIVKSTGEFAAERGDTLTTIKDEIVSGPLTSDEDNEGARLMRSKIIAITNSKRLDHGAKALIQNKLLNGAAEAKLQDMFKRQYFEHISPEGRGPGSIIDEAGYRYIVVGENLAMGNFKDDAALVAAWMASPGHRENMLNTRFSEIGVAVGEGMYNGKKTWLAVQEFGLPASYCPVVNQSLKVSIDAETVRVDTMSQQLITLQKELRGMPRDTEAEEEAYRKRVESYNTLVTNYNSLVAELKSDIEEYNKQVRVYNSCIEE